MQLLELFYKDGDLSMIVLLPKKGTGLPALESRLSTESLKSWMADLRKKKVDLYLPKFKMTSSFMLADPLSEMGMKDAFTSKADFSGMTGTLELFISAILHKAFVQVDEEGTEAAAATAAIMIEGMAMPSEEPVIFRADHPFLFLIRDVKNGSVLFMGRVSDPSK